MLKKLLLEKRRTTESKSEQTPFFLQRQMCRNLIEVIDEVLEKYHKQLDEIFMDKPYLQYVVNVDKVLEALKRFETCAESGIDQHSENLVKDMELLRDDISIVQQAIYRNIPVRVKIVETRHSYDGKVTHRAEVCPICNHDVSFCGNFCGNCGVALKSK